MLFITPRFENKISKQTNIYIHTHTHRVMHHLMAGYVLRNASLGDFIVVRTSQSVLTQT